MRNGSSICSARTQERGDVGAPGPSRRSAVSSPEPCVSGDIARTPSYASRMSLLCVMCPPWLGGVRLSGRASQDGQRNRLSFKDKASQSRASLSVRPWAISRRRP